VFFANAAELESSQRIDLLRGDCQAVPTRKYAVPTHRIGSYSSFNRTARSELTDKTFPIPWHPRSRRESSAVLPFPIYLKALPELHGVSLRLQGLFLTGLERERLLIFGADRRR
jgi:hypothetical protein